MNISTAHMKVKGKTKVLSQNLSRYPCVDQTPHMVAWDQT